MPRESFSPSGIIQDIPSTELARYGNPDAWTNGVNFNFRRGPAQTSPQGVDVFGQNTPPIGPPLDVFSSIDASLNAWMYPFSDGVTKGIGVTDGQTHQTITPAGFLVWASDTANSFTDFSIGGLPGFNWGTQAAYWKRDFGTPGLMLVLPGTDDAGASDPDWVPKCASMRSHQNRLMAMNTSADAGGHGWATTEETLVWSSLPPDGDSMPDDWYPRIDNSAGSAELSGGGPLIDGFSMRSSFVAYCQDRIFIADEIGGSLTFNIRKLSSSTGVLSRNCVAVIPGGHVVLSGDDVYYNDGQSIVSLVDNQIKRSIFAQMGDNWINSFAVYNAGHDEVKICIPTGANIYPNLCFTLDLGTKKWGISDLPNFPGCDTGPVPFNSSDPISWDDYIPTGLSWDNANRIWNQAASSSALAGLVFADPAITSAPSGNAKRFVALDAVITGPNANLYGSPFIERADYDLGDDSKIKTITRIWPRIEAPLDRQLELTIGVRDSTGNTPWTYPVSRQPWDMGNVTDGLSVFATGRYFLIKWSRVASPDQDWTVNGFDVEFEYQGGF